MVTINQKLNLFSKLVYQDILDHSIDEIKNIDEENKKYIEDYKSELIKKAESISNQTDNKIIQKKNEIISKAHLEVKQNMLLKKQEFIHLLLNEQISKAKNFVKTNDYIEYFKKCLENILYELEGSIKIQIELLSEDRKAFQAMIEKIAKNKGIFSENITYIDAEDSIIGGMIVSNEEKAIRYDATVFSLLEDKKELIMNRLYEELKKVGDSIDK